MIIDVDGGDNIRRVGVCLRLMLCGGMVDGHVGRFRQRCGGAGVRDSVLAGNNGPIFQSGGDVVREIRYDGG